MRAVEIFGSVEAAAVWLSNAQPGLKGQIPLEVQETEAGRRWILGVLMLIDYGDPI
jgi:uncharacterized protein (DUF2384 family)